MFNRQVSSVEWKVSKFFIALLKSLIKIKKSKGRRSELWSAPYFTVL